MLIGTASASWRSKPFLSRRRSTLGTGQAGAWLSSRLMARGDRTSTPMPASPPSAFWKEKVVASSLSHSSGMAKAAEVASQMVSPSRPAAMKPASGTRTPEVVPFQAKTRSQSGRTRDRSGSSP